MMGSSQTLYASLGPNELKEEQIYQKFIMYIAIQATHED